MQRELHTITEVDDLHEAHVTEVHETIWDNPVEVTTWVRCHDCDVVFKETSTRIVID